MTQFNIVDYLRAEVPADITLAELKASTLQHPDLQDLVESLPHGRKLRVRFLQLSGPETWSECPDFMTIGRFRELCGQLRAKIHIDDLGGGVKVSA